MRRLTTVLTVLLVLSLFTGVGAAQEVRTGDRIVVEEGETIGDLTTAAGTIVVQGTVDGDLTAFGGDVLIEGEVTGDVEAFAGNVRITGDVDGEASTAAGNVVVGEGATVGSLSAAGGTVAIEGTVAGDAEAAAGSVTLGPAAVVEGDLTYDGELNRHPDARVAGTVSQEATATPAPVVEVPAIPWWVGQGYWLVVNLVFGAVLLAVFPRFSEEIAATVREEAPKSGGVGLLALVGIPIVLVLIALTLIGVPLSIVGAFVFALLLWIGSIYGGFAVGRWLLSLAEYDNRWVALVVGLVVVALLGLVPILGEIVGFVVLVLGLGALVLSLRAWYSGRTARRADRTA